MKLKKLFLCVLLTLVLASLGVPVMLSATEQNPPFPAYGSGPIEVRLYTDYFCPPCRAMEPDVEPLLKELLKKGAIRLSLVDVPFNPLTPLFARYFLYTIKESNALEDVLKARNVLQNAATNKEIKTQEQIVTLFKEKGIAFSVWDPKPVLDRYNALLTEDKINATPTIVIIRNGQRKSYVGGPDIINALKALP